MHILRQLERCLREEGMPFNIKSGKWMQAQVRILQHLIPMTPWVSATAQVDVTTMLKWMLH